MPLQLFQFLFKQSRRTLVLSAGAGLISGATNAGMLALVNVAISRHAPAASVLFAFAGLCLLAPIARACSELLLIRLSQNALLTLRTGLSRQVVGVALCKLERLGPHRILSALAEDLPRITEMVSVVPVLCINIGVVVSCLVYMGWLQPVLLLEVLGFMLVGILTYQIAIYRAARHLKAARQHENYLYKQFCALTNGIKELKLHRRRRNAFVSTVLHGGALSARSENIAGLSIYSAASSWGQLLVFLAIGLLVFVLAAAVHASSGVISGFTLALLYIMGPLQMIMNALPGLKRADVAIRNVQELGLALAESPEAEATVEVALDAQPTRLDISGLTYAYQSGDSSEQFVLGPIDLTILPGELLFITGGNGSGKTTLAKLLVGLYEPDSGDICWNGKPVTGQNRDDYRQLFSAVFSDSMLFESLLGLECMDLDARARKYLHQLRLEHKVHISNGEFSTTELSQGQRKRLALLTACLEDRPVYFLDEWAADQDPTFKNAFYTQILPELKARGKTIVVISHDDHFYYVADRVIKLESGEIISEVVPDQSLVHQS
jgi:putative ATP-binding cassette transporter